MQLNNSPGFATSAGAKTLRFWAMSASKQLATTMEVQWPDAAGNVLARSSASIATLTATAPVGTSFATVTFTGTAGVAGNSLYLDEIYVGI